MTGTSIAEPREASRDASGLRLRLLAGLLAGSLATAAAGVSYWLKLYWWDLGFGPTALIGIGVGLVLGFISGPGAVATPRPVLYAFAVASKAALLGLAVLCAFALAAGGWGSSGPGGGAVVEVVAFSLIAVVPALALALPVTTPIALLTTVALRLASRRPATGRLAMAAVVGGGALLTGVALGVPRPEAGFDAVDLAPVHVEWTVANHSTRFRQLGVFDRGDGGGYGGALAPLEPCFITTDRAALGVDWFLTLEPHPGDATELVSAADAPGGEVRVWIELAADGESSVEVGRGAPSAEEQTVDLCAQRMER